MKKRIVIAFAAFIFTSGLTFAQESSYVEYRVNKGETISKIARDNKVSVSEILTLNPDYKTGIKEGDVIRLPGTAKVSKDNAKSTSIASQNNDAASIGKKTHLVEPRETLFGISRKYNVTVENLYKWNPLLEKEGLKANTVLYLESNLSPVISEQVKPSSNASYKEISVAPKQTLYGLAHDNNVTVQQITELNPEVKDGLKIGQILKIPITGTKAVAAEIKKEVSVSTSKSSSDAKYNVVVVEPKQTVFSLSKEYGISAEEFIELNPEVRKGLVVGMEVKVPANVASGSSILPAAKINKTPADTYADDSSTLSYADFTRSLDKSTTKELSLLLPFNVARLGDNLEERMKSDGFLNMTMDFYLGAKLAINKAIDMGLPLVVRTYDSNETKSSSDVKTILNENEFSSTDVVIGPFFQNNVDEAVKALPNKNIVLFSPLSNEKANSSNQLVQTMPYGDVLKKSLIEYFNRSNSTITVIVDPKRTSTKQFMQRNFPGIKVVETSAIKDIDKTLVSSKNNVFILDSGSIESALLLTDKLKGKNDNYTITVGSFDKNDAFDYSEIKIATLVALNYTFPSVTRDSQTQKDTSFVKEFKAQNNTLPNRFSTRGYDVTFDVIMRMFQKDGFYGTLNSKSTEIENKFAYSKNSEGTIRNTGVFILQYNDDLTVKVLE